MFFHFAISRRVREASHLLVLLAAGWLLLVQVLFPQVVVAQSCGDDGQRACCVGETNFGPCRPGNVEIPQPNSGRCGGFNPFGIQSSGVCVAQTPCGGEGQRACCVGEANFGACQGGLAQVPQPNSGQCSNSLPGIQSSGVCVAQTPCGGEGQRPCNILERLPSCDAELVERPLGVTCVHPPCGRQGEQACTIAERIPSCDGSLVESGGVCLAALPCTLPDAAVIAAPPPDLPRSGIRKEPFTMVVLGDSVSWGQGLTGLNKYSGWVAKAIESAVGVQVKIVMAAHSGAQISASLPSNVPDEKQLATPGEVPNRFPTIEGQVDLAAEQIPPGIPVDLVLVGGCINGVGVERIISPFVSAEEVVEATRAACNIPVMELLQKIGSRFPNARIVLTGYYPIISNSSNLTDVGAFLATAGVVVGSVGSAVGSATLGVPILDPVTGAVLGTGFTEVARRLAAMNAQAFYVVATSSLAQAARSANKSIDGRVSFACPQFGPDNAYAGPDTWLWLIPDGGTRNDQVYDSRNQICEDDKLLVTAGGRPDSLTFNLHRIKCKSASSGHPNLLGAEVFGRAILHEIEGYIPYWRAQFTPEIMGPAEPDTDRLGEDYNHVLLGQQGWDLCQATCAKDQQCQSWTYAPAGWSGPEAHCWLKNGMPLPSNKMSLVSGVKRFSEAGLEIDIDRPGLDYVNIALPSSDPRLCEAACIRDRTCGAWTYAPAHRFGPQALCWLKNPVPASFQADGLISGVKPSRR